MRMKGMREKCLQCENPGVVLVLVKYTYPGVEMVQIKIMAMARLCESYLVR